jgi:hypothetical protein
LNERERTQQNANKQAKKQSKASGDRRPARFDVALASAISSLKMLDNPARKVR